MYRILLACLLACSLCLATATAESLPEDTRQPVYERGVELMDNGEYDAAIAVFESLGAYLDSEANLLVCHTAKNDRVYESAMAMAEAGQYDTAAQVFALIPDHRDASVQLILCQAASQAQAQSQPPPDMPLPDVPQPDKPQVEAPLPDPTLMPAPPEVAADGHESEPNDTFETATPIHAGTLYTGTFATDKDIDFYRITLDAPGMVEFHFEHEYFDDGNGYYKTHIFKGVSDTATLFTRNFTGRESDMTFAPFYLAAGDYYVRVRPGYHSEVPYAFMLTYTPMGSTELEFNDDFATATQFAPNERVYGAHSYEDDKDFYTFTLPEAGEVQLNFRHEYFDDGSTFYKIRLYDRATSDGALYTENITGRNSDFTRAVQYLDAGTYYFCVNAYYWTRTPYDFSWSYTPMEHTELERNNTYTAATPMQVNTPYHGSLITEKDVDYYTFTLDVSSAVSIAFDYEYLDDGGTFFLVSVDMTPNNANRYFNVRLSGRNNGYASDVFYLPAGEYYVAVEPYNWTARPYTVTVNAQPHGRCELEWNNTYSDATPLQIGHTASGSLRYDGDVDIYRLEVAEATAVQLHFAHPWFDDGGRYYAVHLDAQPNNSQRLETLRVKGNENDVTSEAYVQLTPGTYYVVVEKESYTSRPYELRVE